MLFLEEKHYLRKPPHAFGSNLGKKSGTVNMLLGMMQPVCVMCLMTTERLRCMLSQVHTPHSSMTII